ncbi:MAG TPA: type II secretion system minor pseudopilin GspJ [Steroidobacteraceae bacterium]|nr:type II secretion system minor pseudopilin GspJ [Steroidobacteraceae bacterium]
MRPGCRRPLRGFTLIELVVALFITAIIFAMGYGVINQALKDRGALEERQTRLTAVQNAMRVMVQDFTQLSPRPVRDVLGQSALPSLMGNPNGISLTPGSLGSSELGADSGGLGTSNSLGSSSGLGSSFGSDSSSSSSSSSSAGSSNQSSGNGGFDSDNQALDLVVFTRAGWANPAGIQRPALARVSYRLENGVLRRVVWPELDVAQATTPIVREVLDHVKAVHFRYLTDARQWIDQWPPLTTIASSPLTGNQVLRMRPLAVEVTLDLDDWGTLVRIVEVAT